METLRISIGNEGGRGFLNSEMEDMNNEQNVSIPPVRLDSFADFKNIANEAAVVVYSPQYYQGPFTDEPKQLCRLTLTALGVRRNNVPITFKYVIDDVRDIDRVASEMIMELENLGNLVRGTVESAQPISELLATWP
ncbi:hypothetical protein EU528_05415 [Candidatus Thorarchaeota archaeon]|nr:MAG: hypothetical protein EU528_05415 [Candidatus Thorarchaeota archaeon]